MDVSMCVEIRIGDQWHEYELTENGIDIGNNLERVKANLDGRLFTQVAWISKNGTAELKIHPKLNMSFDEQKLLEKIGILKKDDVHLT